MNTKEIEILGLSFYPGYSIDIVEDAIVREIKMLLLSEKAWGHGTTNDALGMVLKIAERNRYL